MGYTDARLDSMLIIEAFIGQMTDTFLLFHFIKLCKVDFLILAKWWRQKHKKSKVQVEIGEFKVN